MVIVGLIPDEPKNEIKLSVNVLESILNDIGLLRKFLKILMIQKYDLLKLSVNPMEKSLILLILYSTDYFSLREIPLIINTYFSYLTMLIYSIQC